MFVDEHSKENGILSPNMETVATNSTTKAEIQTAAFIQATNQTWLPIFGGAGGEGGASAVWSGCGGLPLQKRLSIGAASVSSPSHQTGA